MQNNLKNWLTKAATAIVVISTLVSIIPAYANYEDSENLSISKVKFIALEVENRIFDPWAGQEARIKFNLDQTAEITLEIYDEDDELIVTPVDKKQFTAGEWSVKWDGYDNQGEIVDQDEYSYKLIAKTYFDKETEKGTFVVKKGYDQKVTNTSSPRLTKVFTTKDEFDPNLGEENYIVFTLETKSDLKINIYDRYEFKLVNLIDKEDVAPGTYGVAWDGEGSSYIDGTYTYVITAQNEKGADIEKGEIKIAEEDKEDKKPNIIKDKTDNFVFAPKNNNLEISFTQELDSEVTVEIRNGSRVVATLIENKELVEGKHTIYWDGRDSYRDVTDDGIYEYKILAANFKGKDVEKGRFQIKGASKAAHNVNRCAEFEDIDESFAYCDAVKWAKSEDVVSGYYDGTFRPSQPLTRVEALKVILTAFKINLVDSYGRNLGFDDIDRYSWYAKYLETALNLGIVKGYNDGTFRPNNTISRIEFLTILLNTAKAKDGLTIPSNYYDEPYYDTPNNASTKWYLPYAWFAKAYELTDNNYYFYPNQNITRGEMVDMLYRYFKNVKNIYY